jgi:RND superfamily putative drug exporter
MARSCTASALAPGILFDAVVRMILMPSALALLGAKRLWMPRRLGWLPRLDAEGPALKRAPGEATPEPLPR